MIRLSSDTIRGGLAVCLLRLLSSLPFPVLQKLGTLLGWLLYVLKGRSRRTMEANLLYCFPQWTAQRRDDFIRRSLKESAKTAVEMSAIWHWPCDKTLALIREVHGREYLDIALAKKRGVILLTPHLGNWEIVGFFAAPMAQVTSLYAPAKIPALDQLMYAGRTRNGSHLVPTNASGVRALLKALKAGEMVIILPDQVPEKGSGVFASFFAQPAFTMTLLNSLALRTGAEIVCCYAKRRMDGQGFDIEILPAHESIVSQDEQVAAEALNRSVERCMQDCLEQYQWAYKRFRECLPGGKNIYKVARMAEKRI